MPLEFQQVPIIFEGMDEKTDRKLAVPGRLRVAKNVVFTKRGGLRKRRTFEAVGIDEDIYNDPLETQLLNVATFSGELLIFGAEMLWAIIDIDGGIGESVVRRGPVLRGSYAIEGVYSSSLGDEVA